MRPFFIGIDPLTSVSEVQRFLDHHYAIASFDCIDFDEIIKSHISDTTFTASLYKMLYKEFSQEEYAQFRPTAWQLYKTFIEIGFRAISKMDLPSNSVIVSSWWLACDPYPVLGFVTQPFGPLFVGLNEYGNFTLRDHVFLDGEFIDLPDVLTHNSPWKLNNKATVKYLDQTIRRRYGIIEDAINQLNLS